MSIWYDVEEALDKITDDYIKVNHIISMFQDERVRLLGLHKIGLHNGITIELGSGPGNFSKMIIPFINGPLICFDYSTHMHKTSKNRNPCNNFHYIRGIFEALPFRTNSVTYITSAFAIRDTLNKETAFKEISNTLRKDGKFLLIDIGKPSITIIKRFMGLYIKYIVPILGGLRAGYGIKNPWRMLYKTYKILPDNRMLIKLISKVLKHVELREIMFGALIIEIAQKS